MRRTKRGARMCECSYPHSYVARVEYYFSARILVFLIRSEKMGMSFFSSIYNITVV